MRSEEDPPGSRDALEASRRWFLSQCGVGLGAVALNHLLARGGFAATTGPLAPKPPHFAP